MNKSVCLVLTTCPSQSEAETIASALVERQLAACVNIIPSMTSVYRWQGQVQREQECQLVIKTQQAVLDRVHDCVMQRHPYDLPEWLIIEVSDGFSGDCSSENNAYLKWLDQNIKK